jgi:hypothetical protein
MNISLTIYNHAHFHEIFTIYELHYLYSIKNLLLDDNYMHGFSYFFCTTDSSVVLELDSTAVEEGGFISN